MTPTVPLSRVSRPAALAAVAALSLAGCSLFAGDDDASPSPSPSATAAEPSPSPSPSPSPEPEPHEVVSGSDVGVLARLEAPTTGEVWQDPVPIDNLGLFEYEGTSFDDDYLYFQVGSHGPADIVVAVPAYFDYFTGGYGVYAMFEVTPGDARMLQCPSSRETDACFDWSDDWIEPGRDYDYVTTYDSLTYPERVEPLPGWTLEIAHTASSNYLQAIQAYGEASEFPGIATTAGERQFLGRDGSRIEVLAMGESMLAEYRRPAAVPGLTDSRLGIETPYGAVIPSQSTFTAPYYGQYAVTWNDGVDTWEHPDIFAGGLTTYPVRSAGLACFGPDETLADDLDPTEWEVAGSHVLGMDVYLPVAGGNDLARDVWETMRDESWGEDIDPALAYPYDTFDAFLDDRSVFAWQRPDGEWVIAINGFAGQRVWECA